MKNELIYTVKTGVLAFESISHVHSFTKYLFSCSGGHVENADTKRNFALSLKTNEYTFKHIKKPTDQYTDFRDRWRQLMINENVWLNDLFYSCFAVVIEDRIITNMIVLPEGISEREIEDRELLVEGSVEIYSSNAQNYDDTVQVEDVIQNMAEFTNLHNKKKVVWYQDCDIGDMEMVDQIIHKQILDSFIQEDFTAVLSVTHYDQQETNCCYHIHRLMLENKKLKAFLKEEAKELTKKETNK